MSRSAADATRFTATGPYASSKPSSSSSSTNLASKLSSSNASNRPKSRRTVPQMKQSSKTPGGTSPAGNTNTNSSSSSNNNNGTGKQETPQEKVARLRAQARANREASGTSGVDRLIETGRRIANRAHKTVVYSLIAASGACGVLTVYAMCSLVMYNRRQRALWLDQELEKLQQARIAYTNNVASAEQMEILKNEKIGEIAKQRREREREDRPWNRAKRFLFSGLKTEESGITGDGPGAGAGTGQGKMGVLDAVHAKTAEDKAAASTTPSAPTPAGGQLDVMAENAESVVKESTRSWKSWFFGR